MPETPEGETPPTLTSLERVQLVLGVVTAIGCVGISAADFFGLLGSFSARIPTLTLLLLGVVSGYLVFERQTELRSLGASIRALEGATEALRAEASDRLDALTGEFYDLRSSIRHVDSFFGAASLSDRFAQLRLLYAARELSTVISPNTVTLDREYVFSLWLDCLKTADEFLAFNYVRPDEVWTGGWFSDISLAEQKARVQAGHKVRRVFVIDSDDEKAALMPLMQRQKWEADIDVKWAYTRDVVKQPQVADFLVDLKTWDLIALDDDLIMRVYLDKDRSMQSCSVTKDISLANKVKHVFFAAYDIGKLPTKPRATNTGHTRVRAD